MRRPIPSFVRSPLVAAAVLAAVAVALPARFTEPLRSRLAWAGSATPATPMRDAPAAGLEEAAPGSSARSEVALVAGDAREVAALRIRVRALEDEVTALRRQLAEASAARDAIEGAPAILAPSLITTRVTADHRASTLREVVRIGAGASRGVRAGAVVLSEGALVGLVESTDGAGSLVRLLCDGRTRVRVRVGDEGPGGILRGDGPGAPLLLQLAEPDAPIEVGATVLVDDGSSVAPGGVPVGVVEAVEHPPGELLPQVRIAPLADLTALRVVTVSVSQEEDR